MRGTAAEGRGAVPATDRPDQTVRPRPGRISRPNRIWCTLPGRAGPAGPSLDPAMHSFGPAVPARDPSAESTGQPATTTAPVPEAAPGDRLRTPPR